jgi:2-polyprenyl-6-methoxyphenol hydroxylase-like FAD-dependent oxidoreductase
MAEHVVIIGGGIGGLTAALGLARAGYPVTILERDPLPPTADVEETFRAERRGAPQVHQTHGFLARIQVLLRDEFPDVFADLLEAGALTMPMTANLGQPQPGDEDLKVIITRRTTLEWVLRRATTREANVTFRTDVGVAGLLTAAPSPEGIPTVIGVRLEDGEEVTGDIVVAATGRRGTVPQWLADIGVEISEEVVESGLMYVSRWYRDPGHEIPQDAKLGGDLGFVKFLGVPGDGGTLSVTLAIRADDKELRTALADPDRFDEACRLLPGPDFFWQDGPLEPMTDVLLMSGLLNRLRSFTDDHGAPRVLGFHAIGDAHTTTNPLYGRGCSLAAAQALLLRDAIVDHPGDARARAEQFDAGSTREIEPWFHASVQMDKMGADPMGQSGLGGAGGDSGKVMAAVFVAAQTDPVIGRTFARLWNLLITPAELMADGAFLAKAAEVAANPDAYPVPERVGPKRGELLAALGALDAA